MKKALVTGAAGFIASHLCDRLVKDGYQVIGVDNLSTGNKRFLAGILDNPAFRLVERDITDPNALKDLLDKDTERVFHLAANADVRFGLNHPRRDLEQNLIATWNVLEAMRERGVKNIAFSSTGSVYGEAPVIPSPETCPFPIQTSLYGAAKAGAEGFISAYAEGYGMKAHIFRFVSILGERYTHGHVFDFVRKLQADNSKLDVLGNGKQRKSYLYIGDCVEAIMTAVNYTTPKAVEIYNLGTDEYTTVDASIETISQMLNVRPEIKYAGGERGWIGDNPFIFLDCTKIKSTGWVAKKSIKEGVELTVKYLLANPWVFDRA